MLRRAEVGETPADNGVVEPGMTVTYKFAGDDDVETFLLGAREMEDTTEGVKVYSPQSPLGSAIIGKKKGDTVTYDAPNGKTLEVEIVDAVPYTGWRPTNGPRRPRPGPFVATTRATRARPGALPTATRRSADADAPGRVVRAAGAGRSRPGRSCVYW